jgi:nucleotide-binding universal stress UspA family protein
MKTKLSNPPGKTRRQIATTPKSPQILKILATTDFSEESEAGVRFAIDLAEKLGAGVTLLHVIDPPSRLSGMEAVVLARQDSEMVARARAQLAVLIKRESKGAGGIDSSLRIGKPFHEITLAAREQAVDLIVTATHGHTGVKHVLLGSTAERVVRHAPCPVLTVPTRATLKRTGKLLPFKLKRILVPIDFSKVSKDALPWATFVAEQFGAVLILLHVLERFPGGPLLGRELMNETITPFIKQAEAELKHLAGRLAPPTATNSSTLVRDGTPFEEICQAAGKLGADLIILTTHGYTGLKHVWLGSTAERVVRHAHCPVLVVREPNRKKV